MTYFSRHDSFVPGVKVVIDINVRFTATFASFIGLKMLLNWLCGIVVS